MTFTTAHMSISLDGFVAGPDQSREDPLGKRGWELHGWHIGDPRANDADKIATEWLMRPRGAYVMGRNMFGPIRGELGRGLARLVGPRTAVPRAGVRADPSRHDPIEMDGGTTFHFVTEGFDAAYAQRARPPGTTAWTSPAGPRPSGRHSIAGVIDELTLDIAPVLLGSGERIFDGVEVTLEPVEVEHSPWATHVRYRVSR